MPCLNTGKCFYTIVSLLHCASMRLPLTKFSAFLVRNVSVKTFVLYSLPYGCVGCLPFKAKLYWDTVATGLENLCWFCLLRRLITTFSLNAFGIFWTISDMVFKANILPTCNFLKDRLVTWVRPFPFPGQHRSNIGHEYLKWLALQNIRSLACVTKPTVCKQSKRRYSPLQTTMNWWYNCQK